MTDILQARAVVRSYGATPALRGVTLGVAEGEILAVTGASGCGKSTLLHCLAGIMRPDSGEVTYRGHRIDTMSEAARSRLRRTEFGVLFQFGQLVADLTAAQNVALPLLLAGAGRREARTAALGWLERVGVAEVADSRPGEMSGGQQQRCAMARALVTEPRVVFADEPTGRSTRSPVSRCWVSSSGSRTSSTPPSCWSRTRRGSPGTPTARSSCATVSSTRAAWVSRCRPDGTAGDRPRAGPRTGRGER